MNHQAFFSLTAAIFLQAVSLVAAPIDLGTKRELFVDHFLIEKLDGLELRLNKPVPAGVVLRLDRPWEGIVSGYFTVIKEGSNFHMYYRGRPTTSRSDGSAEAHEVTCYAQSNDGIVWTRPSLGLFEINGTRENNVILTEPKNVTHNLSPFLDGRPGVPATERFKAVGGTGVAGLFGFVSADGIRWKPAQEKPLITQGEFDSQNVVFWSENEGIYVCYFRRWLHGVRWITRSTSPDFLNWTKPVDMSYGETPPEHLYVSQTQPYFRAPHIYIATPARFYPGRRPLTDAQVKAIDLDNPRNYAGLKEDCSDAAFMSSRGGSVYDRTFMESFIRPGGDLSNWVARANYPVLGVVPTGPREMSIYVGRHYGQPSVHIERMTLRTDGFSSVHASYKGGEMLTKPFRFSGRALELNFASSAGGGLRVEIQDAEKSPIPGYLLSDCPEIIGDQIDRIVSWKTGHDLSSLTGKPVRLRFSLKDGDLYSLRFRP